MRCDGLLSYQPQSGVDPLLPPLFFTEPAAGLHDASMVYLHHHDLERHVSEALVMVVNERASNPCERMAELLLEAEKSTGGGGQLRLNSKQARDSLDRITVLEAENKELKEKLKSFAEQQDKEHKMLQESFNHNKNKAIGSPVLVPGKILDLSQSREPSTDKDAGHLQSQIRIKDSKPKPKSKSSFLGFHCCGTER